MNIKATTSEALEIYKATNKENPKQKDIKALDKYFDENPDEWESFGNIAEKVKEIIIKNEFVKTHLVFEATKRKLADLRDQCGWENSSRMEKMLIEQVCLNWLRHNLLELAHSVKLRESHTLAVGEHWDKLLTKSQNRYFRACESLARVRKLLADANLKEQQAQNKRKQSAVLANKLLKDLTK